jgi:hypothetical protein
VCPCQDIRLGDLIASKRLLIGEASDNQHTLLANLYFVGIGGISGPKLQL